MPQIVPTLTTPTALGAYRTTGGKSSLVEAAARWWLASNAAELKLTVLVVAGVVLAGILA